MSDKFRKKYRIESIRMQKWDYRWNGRYFITICTYKMQHLFGEIIDQKMELSNVGVLADVFWHEIKNHTEHIELDAFVVMPNHIHGILIIDNPYRIDDGTDENDHNADGSSSNPENESSNSKNITPDLGNDPGNMGNNAGDMDNNAGDTENDPGNLGRSTARACPGSTPPPGDTPPPDNTPPPGARRFQNIGKKSLSSIIGSYKSAVTKHARRLGYYMEWQERFHDHLIRNDAEYNRIKNYILNNPKKWNHDKFNQ